MFKKSTTDFNVSANVFVTQIVSLLMINKPKTLVS